jgi:hypothetical protein
VETHRAAPEEGCPVSQLSFPLASLSFETVGWIMNEPARLADALAARGLPGDQELSDLFRNLGDTLPEQLQRMSRATQAVNEGGGK